MAFRVATWNMDHWKRKPQQREAAWARAHAMELDAALLQECVPPGTVGRERVLWREIGGGRRWGSAILSFGARLDEVTHALTKYSRHAYSLLQTYPGAVAIGRLHPPDVRPVTLVSVYGVMDPYVQTTLFRMIADLVPLFDSADGQRVIFGGDLNINTAVRAAELPRYQAILSSLESLGLRNLFKVAKERPSPARDCPCGDGADCFHVQTHHRGDEATIVPAHLDYLLASPELAASCTRLWLDDGDPAWELSDHRAVVAEFDLSAVVGAERRWDPPSFVEHIASIHGADAARTVQAALDWAERMGLRVALQDGAEGQWWAQLDVDRAAPQYTFSMRTKGDVVVQFQHMRAPFDVPERREHLRQRLTSIPGVIIPPERISGRPAIPLTALRRPEDVAAFLAVFEDVVRATRALAADEAAPPPSAL